MILETSYCQYTNHSMKRSYLFYDIYAFFIFFSSMFNYFSKFRNILLRVTIRVPLFLIAHQEEGKSSLTQRVYSLYRVLVLIGKINIPQQPKIYFQDFIKSFKRGDQMKRARISYIFCSPRNRSFFWHNKQIYCTNL